jgi:parallel beta-helix repeat protein
VIVRITAMLALLAGSSVTAAFASVVRVPEDKKTIQTAVDAAAPGDVVRVGPGIYRERVLISQKSGIRLEANPIGGAVIDGAFTTSGAAILVVGTMESHVTGVSIVGFRIQNQAGPGIELQLTDRCEILSNSVNNTAAESIKISRSTFTTIAYNTLSNGTYGVGMSVQSSDNTVKENTISGVYTHGVRVAMVSATPLRNTIKENLICVQGASSVAGVLLFNIAGANTVKDNKIVGNGVTTVGIRLEAPTFDNVVKDNIVNGVTDIYVDLGTGNTLTRNLLDGSLLCPQ